MLLWGLEFPSGVKTTAFRMRLCEKANVMGYVPIGRNFVACFKSKKDCHYAYCLLRLKNYPSKELGEVWVWGENLNRKDKFWNEQERI